MPKATEWQRIGKYINAAFIFARADFVNVHSLQPLFGPWRSTVNLEVVLFYPQSCRSVLQRA